MSTVKNRYDSDEALLAHIIVVLSGATSYANLITRAGGLSPEAIRRLGTLPFNAQDFQNNEE